MHHTCFQVQDLQADPLHRHTHANNGQFISTPSAKGKGNEFLGKPKVAVVTSLRQVGRADSDKDNDKGQVDGNHYAMHATAATRSIYDLG